MPNYSFDSSYNFDDGSGTDFLSPFKTARTSNIINGAQPPSPDLDALDSDAYHRFKDLSLQASPSDTVIADMEARRPKRSDYNPNLLTKILAAASGFAAGTKDPLKGAAVADKMLSSGYDKATEDWNQDNSNRLAQARMQDSAFNRKIAAAQFDLGEERQRRKLSADEAFKSYSQTQKNQEDIEKKRKDDLEQQNKDREYGLNTTKTNAQAAADMARANYYKQKGTLVEDDGTEKPLDKMRDQKLNKADDQEAKRQAAHNLINVPGYSDLLQYDESGDVVPKQETLQDPRKAKSLFDTISLMADHQKLMGKVQDIANNSGKKRRFRLMK